MESFIVTMTYLLLSTIVGKRNGIKMANSTATTTNLLLLVQLGLDFARGGFKMAHSTAKMALLSFGMMDLWSGGGMVDFAATLTIIQL